MNEKQHQQVNDPEILSRVASYEMAFRMQSSVPELTDLSQESGRRLPIMVLKQASPHLRTTACLPVDWLNVGFDLCSSTIEAGIHTLILSISTNVSVLLRIVPFQHC